MKCIPRENRSERAAGLVGPALFSPSIPLSPVVFTPGATWLSVRSRVKNVFNLRSLWADMLPRRELRDAYRLLWKIREVKINSSPTVQGDRKAASMRTVIAASAIGTTIEWYDFLIYATAASLVLNKLFSPLRTRWSGSSYRSAPSVSVFSLDRSARSS